MPSPSPSPTFVDFFVWPGFTDVLIPLLGVIASTVVAIAAWRTSRRAVQIAETSHKAAEAGRIVADRLSFATDVTDWIETQTPSISTDRKVTASASRLRLQATTLGLPEFGPWLDDAMVLIGNLKDITRDDGVEVLGRTIRRTAMQRLRRDVERRLIAWIKEGHFDSSPFTAPET